MRNRTTVDIKFDGYEDESVRWEEKKHTERVSGRGERRERRFPRLGSKASCCFGVLGAWAYLGLAVPSNYACFGVSPVPLR